jgi:hypothetical protein
MRRFRSPPLRGDWTDGNRVWQHTVMDATDIPADVSDLVLTYRQAYETAYRFIWQYAQREPVDPLLLMLVAMEPVGTEATNDPASWPDWLACVEETVVGVPLPRFPRTDHPPDP